MLKSILRKKRTFVFLFTVVFLFMSIWLNIGNVALAVAPDWDALGSCIGNDEAQALYMYKSESGAPVSFSSITSLERYSGASVSVSNINDYKLEYILVKSAAPPASAGVDPAWFIYNSSGTLLCPPPNTIGNEGVPYSQYYTVSVSSTGVSITKNGAKHDVSHITLFFSEKQEGSISVTKSLDNGPIDPLFDPQFTFTLTGGPGNVNLTSTIGIGETATFSALPYGTYSLSESSLADGSSFVTVNGYTAGQNPILITIGVGTGIFKNVSVTAVNHGAGKAKIEKTSSVDDSPLENVTFRVSDDTDFTDSDTDFTLTTGADGTATSGWIEPATYYVKEISAPAGYIMEDGYKTVVVPVLGIGSVSFENDMYGTFNLLKIDADTELPIAGVTFELYPVGHPEDAITLTTNASGIASTSGLVAGNYKLRETGAPDGYKFDSNELINVTIEQGQTTRITLENTPHCELILKKVNANDPTQTLPGAQFELKRTDPQGSVLETLNVTIGSDGTLSSDLTPGHWIVRETVAPSGYILDPSVKEVDIALYETKELTFENAPIFGSMKILKLDSITDAPLAGAIFNIYSDEGLTTLVMGGLVTNQDGVILAENMLPGYYWIVETQAPEGYEVTFDVVRVGILPNTLTEVEFTNDQSGGYETGTDDYTMLMVGAMLLIASGIILITLRYGLKSI